MHLSCPDMRNRADGSVMERKKLREIKRQTKTLRRLDFKPLRKGKLPRPFDRQGGARLSSTGLIEVAPGLSVLFMVRDGASVERRAFYGYLMQHSSGGLVPLAIMHYHPSHKGVHLLTNCGTDRDYTERLLPGAPELALRTPDGLDPASERGRLQLVNDFCLRCGIRIAPDDEQLLCITTISASASTGSAPTTTGAS